MDFSPDNSINDEDMDDDDDEEQSLIAEGDDEDDAGKARLDRDEKYGLLTNLFQMTESKNLSDVHRLIV